MCTFECTLCERPRRRRVLKSCVLCRGVYGTCSDTRGWRRRAAARRRGTHLRVLLPLQNARVGLCRTCGGVGSQPAGRKCRNHKWEQSVKAFVDPDTCCGVLPAVGRATASASTLRQRSRAVGTTWRVAAARAVRVLTTCRTRRGPTCGARPKRGGLAFLGRKRGRAASGRVGPRVDLAHLSQIIVSP